MRRLGWALTPALVAAGLAAGFGREMLLAYLYGTSREVEVFRVAFGLPSILSESLAISFVAVLLPVVMAGGGGEEDADLRAAGHARALRASLVVAAGVLLVGAATMPLQAALLAPGFEAEARGALIDAGRLCWGMTALVLVSLPLRAGMSAGGRVWPGASAPLVRSGAFVVALAALVAASGQGGTAAPAVAALVAGAAVLGLHVAALGREGRRAAGRALAVRRVPGPVRPVVAALLAVFAAQLLISGPRVLDRGFASGMEEGVLAAVEHSYALLLAVAVVLATSTNLALAPRIARAIHVGGAGSAGGAGGGLAARERRVLAGVTLAALAAGALIALAAVPVVRLALERGSFGPDSTRLTAGVLEWQAIGLGPAVLAILLTQVMILRGLQRRVLALAGVKLAVKAAALAALIAAGAGAAAFGQSFVIAETAWAALLLASLARRRARGA